MARNFPSLWPAAFVLVLLQACIARKSHSSDDVMLCGQYDIYNSSSGDLSFNSDAWNPDKHGGQCVTVNKNGTKFDATWKWKSDAASVHSYPHVNFNSPLLPVKMTSISSLTIQSQWSMSPGSSPSVTNDVEGLSQLNTIANAALDLFADSDPTKAQSEVDASYEIMIWLGSFGDPKPLGFSTGAACWNQSLGDVIFKLYIGKNHRGHSIFSWVSPLNMTDFNEDISPLLQALWRNGLVSPDALLGLVEFGTEASHSDKNVTFTMSNFGMALTAGPAPNLTLTAAPKSCSKSAAPISRDSSSFSWIFISTIVVAVRKMSEEVSSRNFCVAESTRVVSSRVETISTSSEYSSTAPNPQNVSRELSSLTLSSTRNPFEGDEYVLEEQFVHTEHEDRSVYSSNGEQSIQPEDDDQPPDFVPGPQPVQPVQPVQPAQPDQPDQSAQPVLLVHPFRPSQGRQLAPDQETESPPVADPILPAPALNPIPVELNEKHYNEDIEANAAGPIALKDPEKQESQAPTSPHKKVGIFRRLYNKFRAAYAPVVDPPLVLPICPNDKEKYCYLHTNRIPLYVFGIFAFLSLSAGMWLFVVCSYIFAWFGFFVVLLQFYLIVSYFVGIIGTDYDFESHQEVLRNHVITPENAPTVDIFLPCCMEPMEILENTYKHIQALDYPADKLQVHVMDDGNLEAVKELAARYGFQYRVRDDRPRLKKAGNLRWNFARTTGDFFAIFDADFCPRPDFLKEIMPEHLADDKTAIVQTPQFFRISNDQTWVEQGAGATQELFYRVVQVNRNKWGASICVGSNAVYRRESLEEVGGTAEIGFSEDVHTGFGAVNRGWKVKYMPICLATGVCPDTPRSFFSQQMRWCMGSTTLLSNPEFWKSNMSFIQKVCYMCGMMYYSAVALSIFISPVPGILLLWFRPEFFKYYNLAFAIPSILYGILLFHFWAKAHYGFNVQHIMVIQSYAYLNAIKDKIFGKALMWVPTGDAKAHKSNKYRNMRILCWLWTLIILGGLASAVTYRIVVDKFAWYNCLPLIILNVYNFYLAHPFLFHMG
ncbi:glycosyltransferase family 2 protein [Glonium stellatum]|uniref:Glycosyltransferase family 2 protein n=1 Tax=Glonium stellatum TaxID=574774 RepID=A0A8E2JPB3_9PEZI|nr:glycosyltransferase family 2 protein [Glonium stellatum]